MPGHIFAGLGSFLIAGITLIWRRPLNDFFYGSNGPVATTMAFVSVVLEIAAGIYFLLWTN